MKLSHKCNYIYRTWPLLRSDTLCETCHNFEHGVTVAFNVI